jgi:hypothetical protein
MLLFSNTYECQEFQINNPFDSTLSFGLVNDFWKKKILSLKKDIYNGISKDSYNKTKLIIIVPIRHTIFFYNLKNVKF